MLSSKIQQHIVKRAQVLQSEVPAVNLQPTTYKPCDLVLSYTTLSGFSSAEWDYLSHRILRVSEVRGMQGLYSFNYCLLCVLKY